MHCAQAQTLNHTPNPGVRDGSVMTERNLQQLPLLQQPAVAAVLPADQRPTALPIKTLKTLSPLCKTHTNRLVLSKRQVSTQQTHFPHSWHGLHD